MQPFLFYLDLRCPFCFVQSRRLRRLLAQQSTAPPIIPQTVRHDRPLPIPARAPTAEEQRNLSGYFQRIAAHEEPPRQVPAFWPNTQAASLTIAAAVRTAPEQAFALASGLLEALWIDARDVSNSLVISSVAQQVGLRRLSVTAEDEATLREWTQRWDARPESWRTPVLASPHGATLVGLGELTRLEAFLRSGRISSGDSSVC